MEETPMSAEDPYAGYTIGDFEEVLKDTEFRVGRGAAPKVTKNLFNLILETNLPGEEGGMFTEDTPLWNG